MKYLKLKLLTPLGLLVTVILAGELLNLKKSLAQTPAYQILTFQAAQKCLDADANNGGNGTRVQLWSCSRAPNQYWRHYPSGRIRNVAFPTMCLDADANQGGNGTRVQLWSCSNNDNQKWTYTSGGKYYNRQFHNYLDADANMNARNGTTIQLWQYIHEAKNQKWATFP